MIDLIDPVYSPRVYHLALQGGLDIQVINCYLKLAPQLTQLDLHASLPTSSTDTLIRACVNLVGINMNHYPSGGTQEIQNLNKLTCVIWTFPGMSLGAEFAQGLEDLSEVVKSMPSGSRCVVLMGNGMPTWILMPWCPFAVPESDLAKNATRKFEDLCDSRNVEFVLPE